MPGPRTERSRPGNQPGTAFSNVPPTSKSFGGSAAARAVLVCAVTVATGVWAFTWPTISQDEFSLLIYPDLIAHGRIPNRDFFTPYGPGTFWPLTVVYAVTGGPSVIAARVVGLTYHCLLALGVWALASSRGNWSAVGAGVLAGIMTAGLLLIPYGWVLALTAVIWAMAAVGKGRWAVAGALGAVACTIRPEFLLIVVPVWAVQVRRPAQLGRCVIGVALGAVPLAIHLTLAGPDLYRNVVVDRITPDTRLPLPPESITLFLELLLLSVAVLFLAARAALSRERDRVAAAVLCLGVMPQALQRTDHEHLLFVAVVIVPLAVIEALTTARLRTVATSLTAGARRRLVLVSCVVALVAGSAFAAVMPRGHMVHINDRALFVADAAVGRQLAATVHEVDIAARSDQVLFVGADDMSWSAVTPTYLYYLLPRVVPDAYYLELAPGVSERAGSPLLGDVMESDVLVLSRFSEAQRRMLFPHLKRGSVAVDRYVEDEFCLREEVPGFSVFPDLNIYARCGVGAEAKSDGA